MWLLMRVSQPGSKLVKQTNKQFKVWLRQGSKVETTKHTGAMVIACSLAKAVVLGGPTPPTMAQAHCPIDFLYHN
jgi:hypothetical protein